MQENERRIAVRRIAEIRDKVALIEAELMGTRADTSPGRLLINQRLASQINELDTERRQLEKQIWAGRPAWVSEALMDLNRFVRENQYVLPKGETNSSIEGQADWDMLTRGEVGKGTKEMLQKVEAWRKVYAQVVALQHAIERSIYRDVSDSDLRAEIRREFLNVKKSANVKPSFFEALTT